MLIRLTINNVALIKHIELDFSGALNILSGETGAGKSIIVDSLMLLLGERYDKSILRYGEEKGFVEGVFAVNPQAAGILDEFGYEREDEIVVTRRFEQSGRNDIRINGRSANISMLRRLTSVLVDIYGQNEYQSLSKNSEHLRILQYYVRHNSADLVAEIGREYKNYLNIKKELASLGSDEERERNVDMLKFQLSEINKAAVKEGEEEELIETRRIITGSETISEELASAYASLYESDEGSAVDLVASAIGSLSALGGYGNQYKELAERLGAVSIELKDIAETVSDLVSEVDFDADALEKVESRLFLIRSLKRKYGDYNSMKDFYLKAKEHLDKLSNSKEHFEKLTADKVKSLDLLYKLSKELRKIRESGAKEYERLIEKELGELGMEGARFEIRFSDFPPRDKIDDFITAQGADSVEFYLSANKGQPLKPLMKIISGGEMSRFILAIKVVSSRTDDIPTMIFDEIDTGISGKIGQEVAKKLALISREHQVLCVTHLPQIASMADNHYFIEKKSVGNETITNVSPLDFDGQIDEISRLSGAKDISGQSLENARQMKEWSNSYKNGL